MPLDGVKHPHAQHEKLERQENYGEPIDPIRIHHLNTSRLSLDTVCRQIALRPNCDVNNLSFCRSPDRELTSPLRCAPGKLSPRARRPILTCGHNLVPVHPLSKRGNNGV